MFSHKNKGIKPDTWPSCSLAIPTSVLVNTAKAEIKPTHWPGTNERRRAYNAKQKALNYYYDVPESHYKEAKDDPVGANGWRMASSLRPVDTGEDGRSTTFTRIPPGGDQGNFAVTTAGRNFSKNYAKFMEFNHTS